VVDRSTSRCATLLEAKRLRNDIDANLRRARLPGAFEDESPTALASYIERLAMARQTIDKRIAELGGERRESKSSPSAIATKLSLRDILQQPGAMSFFMEFMDRRNRSMLPQFYLTVEGLKDPLEDPDDLQALSQSSTASGNPIVVDEEAAQALRDDVQLLLSSFVRPRAVTLSATIVDALEDFQQHESTRNRMNMSKSSYKACRRNIFSAQRLCYEEMNELDWPAFQRSDLYNKAAAEVPLPTLHPASSSCTDASVANNTRPRAHSLGPVRAVSTPAIPKSGTNGKKTGGPPSRIPSGHTSASIKSTSGGSEHKVAFDTAFKTDKLDFLTGTADNSSNPVKARSPLFDDEEDPNLPNQQTTKTSD
jgi:sorting nexin-25